MVPPCSSAVPRKKGWQSQLEAMSQILNTVIGTGHRKERGRGRGVRIDASEVNAVMNRRKSNSIARKNEPDNLRGELMLPRVRVAVSTYWCGNAQMRCRVHSVSTGILGSLLGAERRTTRSCR